MTIINVNNNILSNADKDLILNALKSDELIVYPTDTLYGLGVNACSEKAVNRLYELKERDKSPISVLLESTENCLDIARDLSNQAVKIIQYFLPGPMTVICRSDFPFADQLYSERGTIGMRVPGDNISREIPHLLGSPITTTSVNPRGLPPARTISEMRSYFGSEISLILDAGTLAESPGSTVIDLTTHPFKVLREGKITRQSLRDFLN
ncbi:MAG: threonylcarbamoyl-AMP synthase [Candidatus Marinimicrobia bacterium]|nr:threonylcarbamoyl-AMP synthase [Candidatus Neomarinimicrobiota bacterium]